MPRVRKHTHVLLALPPGYPGGSDICVICDAVILLLKPLEEPLRPLGDPEAALAYACVREAVRDPFSTLSTEEALRAHAAHGETCPHRGPGFTHVYGSE